MGGKAEIISIATTQSARVEMIPPNEVGVPYTLLLGFHGYAESAETQLARLSTIALNGPVLCAAPHALHRFYDRNQKVVGSWMTSQDRDQMIKANLLYINRLLRTLASRFGDWSEVVCLGFSQGASMAYRIAAFGEAIAQRVVIVGGDLPPELRDASALSSRSASYLLIRGTADSFLKEERFADDRRVIESAGNKTVTFQPECGHEWNTAVSERITAFLNDPL